MKKYRIKGFSLLEILVTVVIVAILASLAIVGYNKTVESAKLRACDNNLIILHTAVQMYISDMDAIPGSLAMLPEKYFYLAEAKLEMNLCSHSQHGVAYAQPLPPKYYGNNRAALTCSAAPKNKVGPIGLSLATSYVIDSYFTYQTDAKDLIEQHPTQVLISDGNYYHRFLLPKKEIMNQIHADGTIVRKRKKK